MTATKILFTAIVATALIVSGRISGAAAEPFAASLINDEFCPLTFANDFRKPYSGCEGYTLTWGATGSPGEPVCQDCEVDYMWIKVTRNSDGMQMDYQYNDGPVECSTGDFGVIDIHVHCPIDGRMWLIMSAICGPCATYVEEGE